MSDAVHRVLRTDELLREIFGYLDPFGGGRTPGEEGPNRSMKIARATLLSAALCSRSFCEPALNVLWKWQEHPLCLLTLLGPIRRTHKPLEATFDRDLEEEDWATFDKHAKRVRALVIPHAFAVTIIPEYRYVLYDVILRLPKLDSLYTEMDMSPAIVRRLSTLPHLRDLSFDANYVDWDDDEKVESTSFGQLRSAAIEGALPSINSSLDRLSFPNIQVLFLTFKYPFLMRDYSAIMNAKLIDVDWDALMPSLHTLIVSGQALQFAAILPVLTLKHLRHVHIATGEREFLMGDEDICEMARAWPELTTLVLNVHTVFVHGDCLPEMARRCPRLRTVEFEFLMWFMVAPPTSGLTPSTAKLRTLSLCVADLSDASEGQDPSVISDFVSALFPNVEEMKLYSP